MRRRLRVGKKCRASRKRKFASSLDVLIYHAGNPRPIRAYQCPDCGYWHAATRRNEGGHNA